MIFNVIQDMQSFFVVLLLTILAFANAFYTISLANAEDKQFAGEGYIDSVLYTYLIVLGEFNTDEFGDVAPSLVWILFLLCTIFNMIVMLNLLIAIISESFSIINSNAESAALQEMSRMIAENHYLIPEAEKKAFDKAHKGLLLVAWDLEDERAKQQEGVEEQLALLSKHIDLRLDRLEERLVRRLETAGQLS